MKQKVIIIGGGAAGFFTAITAAEANPNLEVIVLEKGNKVLQKVKVSGGGRCNVTHACFDPKELVEFYPRGRKELLGPFHKFMTGDTMEWFENRGVKLKIEIDNRVFPISNSSQTIIDCLINSAEKAGVVLKLNQKVESISKINNQFKITSSTETFLADKLVITTGSNPKFWNIIEGLGHTIVIPVPSLFTFKINDQRIKEIPGISVTNASISIAGFPLEVTGPLLITHWGLSGPAVLKLSSFGARYLADKNYQYTIIINWLDKPFSDVLNELKSLKKEQPKKHVQLKSVFREIPRRLWEKLVFAAEINNDVCWADLSYKQLECLANQLTRSLLHAEGKTTFKEEFVTSGGVDLKEINFKRFESKIHKDLFFAGEVLNIDAVTGGFNFQNAWTGGYIVGKAMTAL